MDLDRISTSFSYILTQSQRIFSVTQAEEKKQSFAEMKKKFNLSDEQLNKQQQRLYLLGLFLMVCALMVSGVAVYYFIQGFWRAGMLSLVVMGIACVLAFRYHFLAFEIKQRKLGCSVSDWFKEGFK
jgi:intracellular multiplication protein IcmV